MKFLKHLILLVLVFNLSCKNDNKNIVKIEKNYQEIKKVYTPDKRVELFDVQFSKSGNNIILTGETTAKEAFDILLDSIKNLKTAIENKVRVLPDSAVGDLKFAIARNSVINIRSKPKHSSELGTQGLLGMPLKVLDKKGDFYRVQTPDNYISWVDKGGITRMNKTDFDVWKTSEKVIYTQNFGYVYEDKNFDKIVSDISLGGVLKMISHDKKSFEVAFPDKRKGFIKIDEASVLKSHWFNMIYDDVNINELKKKNIESTAKSMIGFPYLWGGTSAKGVDCSGFTKMVYLMNGYIIPRDASQQVNAGKIVDPNLTFEGLQKGDLLFFGKKATAEKKQRVTHVGIWLGNGKQEFIHASGNVHISSMDANHPLYDEFNKNRYLGSRRYLGVEDEQIIPFN